MTDPSADADHAAHCGPGRGFRVCYCRCPACRDGTLCTCVGCRATPECLGAPSPWGPVPERITVTYTRRGDHD